MAAAVKYSCSVLVILTPNFLLTQILKEGNLFVEKSKFSFIPRIFWNISNFLYKSVTIGNRPHKVLHPKYIFSLTLCKWNFYSCLIQSFDFRSRLVKSWEIFANWDWLWLCMPAAGNHEETIKPIQSLLHAISLRHAGAAGSHEVHTM